MLQEHPLIAFLLLSHTMQVLPLGSVSCAQICLWEQDLDTAWSFFWFSKPWGAAAVNWHRGKSHRAVPVIQKLIHPRRFCFSKTSEEQAAGSLTPGKYSFCCSCVTGAGQGRIYHFIEAIPLTVIVSMSSASKSAFCSHSSSD